MTGKLRLREYFRFTIVCIVMISTVFSVEVDEELKRLIQEERQSGEIYGKPESFVVGDLLTMVNQLTAEVQALKATGGKAKRLVVETEEDLFAKVNQLTAKVQALEASGGKAKRLVVETEEDLFAKVNQLTAKVQALEASGVGSTYVRWGRTDCPGNGSDLVYKGYAGGSYYTETGGGVNYLCLTDAPIYGHVESGHQASANVYGAEYQLDRNNIAAFIQNNLQEDDVPCAVCTTPRSRILMIPGRNACYAGWTLEYKGYLTSGYSGHAAASEFVCLDDHPVPVVGGHDDQNGKLFYFAEGRCGSLECPPYVDGQELTCVVCSK